MINAEKWDDTIYTVFDGTLPKAKYANVDKKELRDLELVYVAIRELNRISDYMCDDNFTDKLQHAIDYLLDEVSEKHKKFGVKE